MAQYRLRGPRRLSAGWMAIVEGPANETVQGGFWADLDATPPSTHRFRDRVFIGNAVDTNDKRITGAAQTDWGSYANWAPRDSDLAVMSSRGALAITGMSRSSDAVNHGGSQNSTWGVGGIVIVDRASSAARGLYADVQFESGASYGYGAEVVVKNKGADATSSPYFATTGTYGAYLVAGGDNSYGGAPAAPSNTAVYVSTGNHIAANTNYRWNKGIVFDEYSLTGADGTGASNQRLGVALEMAVGHNIRWMTPGNSVSAAILASGVTASKHVTQIFQDDSLIWYGASGGSILRLVHTNAAVNYLSVYNSITGVMPRIDAIGTDTDIDITLSPKGAGVVKFGTRTANGDALVTGYLTIKDAGGTVRKLAIID